VDCCFLLVEPLQAIQGEIHTFADTDSCTADKKEGIGLQSVSLAELLLQSQILVWRERAREVMVAKRKVLATNQIRGKRITAVG
jgi:hypothetical protein